MSGRAWRGHALSALTLLLALLMFFPILWMVLTSFKTEALAITFPRAYSLSRPSRTGGWR